MMSLGGSQVDAAVGVNPFCSPIRLWGELVGDVARTWKPTKSGTRPFCVPTSWTSGDGQQ